MPKTAKPILGVDVGGVIIDRDISFWQSFLFCRTDAYLEIPPVRHAISSLQQLNYLLNGQIVIISKCNEETKKRTQEWFAYHRFKQATGIEQIVFTRSLKEKAEACSDFGVTHFVDNRIAFLKLLKIPSKNRLLLSANGHFWGKLRRSDPHIKIFTSWPDIVAHLKQIP